MAPISEVTPFLKWPGGKRWLLPYRGLFPKTFGRYVEPFLGSGSVFFGLNPTTATLSDVNPDLIACYKCIRSNWRKVYHGLVSLQPLHSSEHYYKVRQHIPSNPTARAIRFLYLNRTCFNGLYRENKKGQFNVPIGSKTAVSLESDNFHEIAKRLKKVSIKASDFERIIDTTVANDFLFIDPPYTVAHNQNGFIKYNNSIFLWEDQIRLKESLVRAKRRGVKVLILNADHPSILSLYKNMGKAHQLSRTSLLSGRGESRRRTTEIAITINYVGTGDKDTHD